MASLTNLVTNVPASGWDRDLAGAAQQVLHTWSTGGWVMMALAMLGVLMYATSINVLVELYYRGLRQATDATLIAWISRPEAAPRRIRELIRYSQDEALSLRDIEGRFREVEAYHVPRVDRKIASLGVMVVAAPLFGLLGTVLGMLLTFKAIGIGGSSVSEIVAKGISEALVATQTGLMVALPGWMAAFLAKRWRTEYVAFLARLESKTLRHFRPRFHGMTRVVARRPKTVPANPGPANADVTA